MPWSPNQPCSTITRCGPLPICSCEIMSVLLAADSFGPDVRGLDQPCPLPVLPCHLVAELRCAVADHVDALRRERCANVRIRKRALQLAHKALDDLDGHARRCIHAEPERRVETCNARF